MLTLFFYFGFGKRVSVVGANYFSNKKIRPLFNLFEYTPNVLAKDAEAQQVDTNCNENKQTHSCGTRRYAPA